MQVDAGRRSAALAAGARRHCFTGRGNDGHHGREREKEPEIMTLIGAAPWREAVTYRQSWPHEYVVVKKDGQ